MSKSRWAGAALIVLSAISFGAMAIFARFAFAAGVDVMTLLFLRFSVSGCLLAVFMGLFSRRWPRGRNLAVLVLMGSVGYVAQSYCFFSALQFATAGLVALLLYLYPFLVMVLGAVFLGERLGIVKMGLVLAAFVGVALTIGSSMDGSRTGVLLGMAAALIYALYILIGGQILREEEPLGAAAVVMLAAAAIFAVGVLLGTPRFPVDAAGWGWVMAIALLSTVVAMLSLFAGIRRLGAADAATLSILEPVVTFALAAAFLNEGATLPQILGGILVLLALTGLARRETN